jgi:PEGA domain
MRRRAAGTAAASKLTRPSIRQYPRCTMTRTLSVLGSAWWLAMASLVGVVGPGETPALAQSAAPAVAKERARPKGRTYKVRIDSSPQQAAVYWDAGSSPSPRDFGIAGYTPLDLKLPKGPVKVIVELRAWKTQERDLDVRKAQTLTLTLERAPMPGKLDLRAGGDGSAAGAEVSIDGVVRGTVPNTFELFAGHHQIEVRKTGYKSFSEWMDISEDEHRTRDLSLDRTEAPSGSLLVTSDLGGDVFVDGTRRDAAPAIVNGLTAGDHIVEVRLVGAPPWRQSVTVVAGQQAKVAASMGPSTSSGALRIISSDADVEVFVDGESKGKAPVDLKDVKAGQHIIEGRKPHFKPQEQNIRVVGGDLQLIRLKLEAAPDDQPHAILKIQSPVPDAEVFLDGSSLGKAPVDRRDLDPGKHYIVVRKDGYAEYKREINLVENVPLVFAAELRAIATLKFLSNPRGATVSVDGEPMGATPTTRPEIAAGEHVVEFKLPGYFDSRQTIKVEGGRERIVSADLKLLPTGPSPEQALRTKTAMSSWGASTLPQGGFTADLGLGYPYIFFARLTVGAFNLKPAGLDLGVEFQSFVQMTTLALHGRMQLAATGPLSVGVRGSFGGGAGSNGKNTVFFDLAAIASLAFADVAIFSLDLRFSAWWDQFCPSQDQVANGVGQDDYCKDANSAAWSSTYQSEFNGQNPAGKHFSGTRLYSGMTVVFAIDRRTSAYLRLDFLPGAGIVTFPQPRPAYEDKFNSVMFEHDPLYYGSAGVSFKF